MTDPTNPAAPTKELRACPFCGVAQAVDQCDTNGAWVEKNDHDDPEFHVHCWSCGARSMEFYDRDQAVAAWNTRAPDPALSVLTVENERLREAAKCVASDMEYATAGGMSWISDGECKDFVRRLRQASSLPAMKGEG